MIKPIFSGNCPECGVTIVVYNGIAHCGLTCNKTRTPVKDFCDACGKVNSKECKTCRYKEGLDGEQG